MYSNVSFQTHVYCQILHAMRNEEELVNALPTLCITYPYVNTVLMHFKILVVFGFITNIYLHLCKAFNLYRLFTLHFYWSKATFMDYLKKLSFYQSTYIYIYIYLYLSICSVGSSVKTIEFCNRNSNTIWLSSFHYTHVITFKNFD